MHYKRLILVLCFLLIPSLSFGSTVWFCDGASASDCTYDDAGFEDPWDPSTSNAGNWDSFTGVPTSEGSPVKKGTVAMGCDANAEYMRVDPTGEQTEVWIDFWTYSVANSGLKEILRNFEQNGTVRIAFWVQSDDEIEIYDEVTTWQTGNYITEGQWQHFFVHYKLAASESEVIQVALETGDYWSSWNVYNNTTATINQTDIDRIYYGNVYADNTNQWYFDALRSWYGSGMPSEWSAPSGGGQVIIIGN